MIDIEIDIFDAICTCLATDYPSMRVENEIVAVPVSLPCACIEEISNSVDTSTIDSGSNENYANVDYEVRVYTNNSFGKRREGRDIMSTIDSWFINKGFIRTFTSFVSFDDGTKYQTISRYQGKTDGSTIYRR